MSPALYLIDTSGLFRILQDKLRQAWSEQLTAGVIAICPIVELEFLYSARSLADRLEKRRLLRELFGWVTMSNQAYDRASEVQQRLTETGKHRSAGPVDLLIAATAERERLIVLCDDRDFQTVASVTGQPVKLVTDVSGRQAARCTRSLSSSAARHDGPGSRGAGVGARGRLAPGRAPMRLGYGLPRRPADPVGPRLPLIRSSARLMSAGATIRLRRRGTSAGN